MLISFWYLILVGVIRLFLVSFYFLNPSLISHILDDAYIVDPYHYMIQVGSCFVHQNKTLTILRKLL